MAPDASVFSPPPWRVSLMAALPIGLCLLVMAVPAVGHGHALAYRTLYLLAFLAWVPVLIWLQRALWRAGWSPWKTVPLLLAVTYLMAVVNNVLGFLLPEAMGWSGAPPPRWPRVFFGVDDCWLALIAYCAANALVGHSHALKEAQGRQAQALLAARDAELRALRYQLNPHFLFNTLNGVSSLVAQARGEEARTMLARLGGFLRATLDRPSHEVSVAEELAMTETYLAIEQVRLGDRLRVEWDIGPGVLDASLPSLLLQPLVENAIRHGIARRSAAGRLSIALHARAGQLQLRVVNDLAPDDEAQGGRTLGHANVRQRLAWLYPQRHAFAAGLEDGVYVVAIAIPLQRLAPRGDTA
ncbi:MULTISPECIES: histidine kinase [Pseudoxanthomonas]|uniref:Two-component system sensor histidine kinase AlgZ n=1 Tax=Pseudoxanthomonas winnipegensis TaxID=2480810 RepID=A0AAW8GG27_9GAMM|nr:MULTISPECIES: histidine kinase [Pseudoxanthomonas]MDQ1121409.1 two-component system sensor histidine kinase AlgZ [Pseudoxanthomonas winnipegensis]MDR6139127.1 two-component system sensor histidine kinase AlgZ [Pseudoxanthomonas sp. SORGH_AS_0997]